MGVSCGVKCAKGFLVTFNLIFWVSGCFLLAMGIYILIDKENSLLFHLMLLPSQTYTRTQFLAWGLVAIGALIFLVGFCGCCGAIRENRALLVIYFIFLFIVMSAELSVGILSVIFQDKLLIRLDYLSSRLKEEYGVNSVSTEAFDFVQTKFNCCGMLGPEDYEKSQWKSDDLGHGDQVSKTCCVLSNRDHMEPKPVNSSWCQSVKPEENSIYRHQQGCLETMEEFIRRISILLVALGCGMATLEVLGMVLSMCLCKEV